MALVSIPKVRADIGWPLVGFSEDKAIVIFCVDGCPNLLDGCMGLGKVFAGCTVAFDEIGNRVHTKLIYAHMEPESHGLDHLFDNDGVIKIEVRLVGEEAMPIVRLRDLVPSPVGLFRVGKDDASVFEELVGLRPNVEIALG